MVNFDPIIGSTIPKLNAESVGIAKPGNADGKAGFEKTIEAIGEQISKVNDSQEASNVSIKDMLAGKDSDITTVVSAMAKADISFKLLVGVRNKLIEAYKQTMNMPL